MHPNANMLSSAMKTHAVGALVCVSLLGVGYQLGIRPMLSLGKTPADWASEVDEAQAQAALHEATVQRLSRELELSQRGLESRPMQLLAASEVNRRLAALSGLAEAHGLTLASSQPGAETALTYYAFVPITLGGQGGFASVVAFLGALHETFPDIGVHAFDLTRGQIGGGRFTLTLNWYVRPSQTAVAN